MTAISPESKIDNPKSKIPFRRRPPLPRSNPKSKIQMDVFELLRNLVDSYASYIRSFIQIRDARIGAKVEEELSSGLLWPEPFVQLNPASFQTARGSA
jgi:hypothetical protein